MYLHCIVVIYLGKSRGAADLFIKGKIAVLPGGWMFLSDSHPRECAAVVQCVPGALHTLAWAPVGTEALWRFQGAWLWSPGRVCCPRAGGRAGTGRAPGT